MQKTRTSSFMTILAFLITFALIYYVGKNITDMEKFIQSWGVAGPIVSILLYGLLSVTPIPTDPISVMNGALFGPLVGMFVSWMGNNVAACVEYFIGKGIRSITNFEERKKNLPWGLAGAPVDSAWFLIGGRFVPGFGSKIVSFLAGIYNVNLWKYVWNTAIANVVGAAIYALGGVQLLQLLVRLHI